MSRLQAEAYAHHSIWSNSNPQHNALVYFKWIAFEFGLEAHITTDDIMRSTRTHAEIMAYLTDYGSLSGEKGSRLMTTSPHGAINALARPANEISVDCDERAEDGSIDHFDPGSFHILREPSTVNPLHLELQFCWPDGFGA